MSIFKKEVTSIQSSVEQLRKKSADSLGIFQRTMEDLSKTNEAIQKEVDLHEEEIKRLRSERTDLVNLSTKNTNVVNKIQYLLGEVTT